MLTRHISRHLAAYLDGALPDNEARRAELHLRDCVRCRSECEQIRSAKAALAQLVNDERSQLADHALGLFEVDVLLNNSGRAHALAYLHTHITLGERLRLRVTEVAQ